MTVRLNITDSNDYKKRCESSNGYAYTIKISRHGYKEWKMAVCDLIIAIHKVYVKVLKSWG